MLVLVLVLDILLEQEASDMERHEVSNEEWGILSSVLEAPRMGRGRRLENSRRTFNGNLSLSGSEDAFGDDRARARARARARY